MPFKNPLQDEDLWEDDLPTEDDDRDGSIEDGSKSGRDGGDEPVGVYGDATIEYPSEDVEND